MVKSLIWYDALACFAQKKKMDDKNNFLANDYLQQMIVSEVRCQHDFSIIF